MARNLSTTVNSAIQQEEISTRMLVEIYLNTSDISSTTLDLVTQQFSIEGEFVVFRFIANDNQDLIISDSCTDANYIGKKYISAEITRGNIDTSTDGQIEKTSIRISNKWQIWASVFANLGNIMNNRKCVVLEYFPDFPSEPPIIIFDGVINGVKMTAAQFEWELRRSVVDFRIESPNMTYDVSCQWRFKSVQCNYSGFFSGKCDKTLDFCKKLSNVLNYGGHPSVPREMVIKSR